MDDTAPKENPPADFNKLDLTQLQGFSFGTQWTQEKPAPPGERDRADRGADRPRREDRSDGPGGGPDRRDRRGFRKPVGPGPGEAGAPAPAGGGGAPERREYSGDRYPRRDGPGENRGGPRREGYGTGDRGARPGYGNRGGPPDRGPYESLYYSVMFYPEDTSFNTLVQTIRKSCRTVELFEIARTVVAKTDRFVVVVAHKTNPEAATAARRPGEADPAAAVKPARPMFHVSVPDGIPFETDEAAVSHVLGNHLDKFFDKAEVEVDPPKGNFQVINKCGVTGELLGPPNYHRYAQIVQQHYTANVSRMPFEMFRSRIETIRDPEVVAQWQAKMKKTTRYTWKTGAKPIAVVAATGAPTAAPAAKVAAPAAETEAITPAPDEVASAPAVEPVAPVPAALTFDNLEDARIYLLTQARDKVVRTTETARVHGKVAETMAPGEIRAAVEGALERQQRFPLDTANALRGRLRREHFTIFKKGSKGVSYVCAVKRKFRVPGQTFSESIGALIGFIESHSMMRASELATKFLGLAPGPKPAAPPLPTTTPPDAGAEAPVAAAPEAPKPEPTLSIEDRARLARMQGDLVWLVREGYVTEFIDGRLFAPPPMVEARKKEIESEEHDPENFPEAPPTSAGAEPAAPAPEPAGAPDVAPAAVEVPSAPVPASLAPGQIEVPAADAGPKDAPPAAVEPAPAV